MTIPQEAIDGNGDVNHAAYVQWIREAAIRHFEALGGTPLMAQAEATWVVRSHKIAGCGKRAWLAGLGFIAIKLPRRKSLA